MRGVFPPWCQWLLSECAEAVILLESWYQVFDCRLYRENQFPHLPTNRDLFTPASALFKQRPARPQTAFVGENTICSVFFPLKNALESFDECFSDWGGWDNICRKAARAKKRRNFAEKVPNPCENGWVGMNQFQFVPLRRKQPGEVYGPGWKARLLWLRCVSLCQCWWHKKI